MDVEARKAVVRQSLEELQADIIILDQRIFEAMNDLEFVTDEKSLEVYANSHELEEGLFHIRLF